MLDRLYSGGMLEKAVRKKLLRRALGRDAFAPCAIYNSLVVFDKGDLEGGGLTFGQDFTRALLELGGGRCERVFEFCSGPAYIGYSLLAHGFCEKLTLSDIDPKAIAATRQTASFNNIDHLVNTYVSDGLKQIPETEKWDLLVSNPPHFLPENSSSPDVLLHDVGWLVHRDFYRTVKKFMKPGAHVVFVENSNGSRPEDFEPMVREGGGAVVSTRPLVLLNGKKSALCYVASKW